MDENENPFDNSSRSNSTATRESYMSTSSSRKRYGFSSFQTGEGQHILSLDLLFTKNVLIAIKWLPVNGRIALCVEGKPSNAGTSR
jgi:hypothetical protein